MSRSPTSSSESTGKLPAHSTAGGCIVISANGTSRTVVLMTCDPSGKKVPVTTLPAFFAVSSSAAPLEPET